jgi:hypothetical protein
MQQGDLMNTIRWFCVLCLLLALLLSLNLIFKNSNLNHYKINIKKFNIQIFLQSLYKNRKFLFNKIERKRYAGGRICY